MVAMVIEWKVGDPLVGYSKKKQKFLIGLLLSLWKLVAVMEPLTVAVYLRYMNVFMEKASNTHFGNDRQNYDNISRKLC